MAFDGDSAVPPDSEDEVACTLPPVDGSGLNTVAAVKIALIALTPVWAPENDPVPTGDTSVGRIFESGGASADDPANGGDVPVTAASLPTNAEAPLMADDVPTT